MKVHVNLAKQMLYEFHRSQNARKSGSVHAIYYLEGTKALASPQTNGVHEKDGDDSVMQSSPFMSSMQGPEQVDEAEDIVRRSSVLAQESDVETAQEQFEVIDTIYVYALASGSLKDLSILGDCSRRIAAEFGAEDPLQAWKTYGVVQNTGVKRRTGKRPPTGPPQVPQVATPASKPTAATKPQPEKPKASASAAKNGVTEGTAVRTAAGAHAAPVSDLSTSKPDAPTLKREKSDIFKSFAKTKPKSKQDSQSESQLKDGMDRSTVLACATAKYLAEPMQSDDEEAEDLVPLSNAVADEAHRKARAERAEKLKKMMEEDGKLFTLCITRSRLT